MMQSWTRKWVRVPPEPDDDGFCYRSSEIEAHLNVAIRLTNERVDASEFSELFEWYVTTMREQALKISPDLELFEVQRWFREYAILGLYQGKQPNGRRLANYVVVNSAGVSSFYFEAFDLSGEEFARQLKVILSAISLVERA